MAADADEEGGEFHLFGNLFLPDPRKHLTSDALERLLQLEPFIRDLKNRQQDAQQTKWSCQEAFNAAVDAKVQLWQQRGVTRRRDFTVGPDGLLEAPVACHLHCPSFSVKDAASGRGADDSNVSIAQIMLVGLTPDRCLIYDRLFRREASDGLRHYPPDILDVHEQFMWELRKNMSAVVDICWGRCVKERMMKKILLSKLPLWGQYKDIDVWLEWRHDHNVSPKPYLARFVLFVMHPEAMIYANKSTQGRVQDLHLSVAARLGNITIDQHFYELNHRRGTYGRLTKVDWARQKELNEEARAHVSICTKTTSEPAELLVYKSQPGIGKMVGIPWLSVNHPLENKIDDNGFDEMLSQDEPSKAESHTYSKSAITILPEVEENFKGPQGLKCLVSSLVDMKRSHIDSKQPFDVYRAVQDTVGLLSTSDSDEFSIFGVPSWEDIPAELRNWLQNQQGLRIDQRPMSSTTDLLHAHQLLCRKTLGFESFEDVSIMAVVVDVAIRYYKQINPMQQMSKITADTITGKHPIPRKCSACGSRVLDDAFPRFKKLEPSRYIVRFLKGGCGLKGCNPKGTGTSVVGEPVDDIQYSRADGNALKRPPQAGGWADILIYSKKEAELLQLPSMVECVCRSCKEHTNLDEKARWTIESRPRYVPSRPRCPICNKKDPNRRPVDESIAYLDVAALTKAWMKIKKHDYPIDEVRRNPDRFFPTSKPVGKGN